MIFHRDKDATVWVGRVIAVHYSYFSFLLLLLMSLLFPRAKWYDGPQAGGLDGPQAGGLVFFFFFNICPPGLLKIASLPLSLTDFSP